MSLRIPVTNSKNFDWKRHSQFLGVSNIVSISTFVKYFQQVKIWIYEFIYSI